MQIVQTSPRTFSIEISQKSLKTPFFFPAVSTVKTNFNALEYVELIIKSGYPGYLVSAYDIYNSEDKVRKEIIEKVSQSTENEVFTFLDSGNYESYWHKDKKWKIDFLESILEKITVDFCFSFDVFWTDGDFDKYIKETITQIAKTAGMQKSGTTVPIIHSTPDLLPKIISKIVGEINPEVISVPERELGFSIFERAKTVKSIRDELNKTDVPIPLHLLGTGNPISILIYSVCGADMYDALEWCKNAVNPKTGHLLHFVQKDLIDCDCKACKSKEIPYPSQTMAHNLNFYGSFLEKLRKSFEENNLDKILDEYLSKDNSSKIKKIAGL